MRRLQGDRSNSEKADSFFMSHLLPLFVDTDSPLVWNNQLRSFVKSNSVTSMTNCITFFSSLEIIMVELLFFKTSCSLAACLRCGELLSAS